METQLRQQIEQKHRAEADLIAVRDLCVKLDQQKDTLVEQLGDKDTVKAHVNLLTLYSSRFYCLHIILVSPLLCFFFLRIVRSAIVKTENRAEHCSRSTY